MGRGSTALSKVVELRFTLLAFQVVVNVFWADTSKESWGALYPSGT